MEFFVNQFKLIVSFAFSVIVFSKSLLKLVSLISVVDRLTGFYMDCRVYWEHGLMGILT